MLLKKVEGEPEAQRRLRLDIPIPPDATWIDLRTSERWYDGVSRNGWRFSRAQRHRNGVGDNMLALDGSCVGSDGKMLSSSATGL